MAESFYPVIAPAPNLSSSALPTVPSDLGVVTGSQSEIKDLFGLFCMVTLDLIALLANIGVMVAIARAPHLKRFAFVCHLCAVDVLCAVLLMPLGIISSSPFFGTVVFTILECQVYIFLNVFLICLSIFTVTAISIERYFYIVHPMRYEVNMTVNLVIVVMLLIWIKSLLLAMVTSFGWPAYGSHSSISAAHCSLHASHSSLRKVFAVLFSVTCFMVPSFVIFAVYCAVYKVARSAALQQAPVVTPCQAKDRSDSINSQTTMITTTRTIPKRLSPERAFSGGKAALTLVFIVGQFLICWLPYFIFHLQMALSGSMQSPGDLEEVVNWLAFSSFAVNPFFYGLLNRQIRDELVKFRRCCWTQTAEMGTSSHEGSLQENFMQFIQRTTGGSISSGSSNSGRRTSLRASVEREQKIPGQVPEEAS
ncbi:probable G-protein coupled receptor [Periophthalmus magnuspinnatus]|uniref:probable G-protein coupled receptor n=1 Tax=Periophthalmus magnuspinnatus TaxID=409849 RepID=UPI00145BEB0E|nr:probable G-protein coupled receptor [Periophthalmus magnuspinnatus]